MQKLGEGLRHARLVDHRALYRIDLSSRSEAAPAWLASAALVLGALLVGLEVVRERR
jgi:hypothetical protein